MDSVASFLTSEHSTAFSFEILPPLRGNNIAQTYRNIERLLEFNPAYVNITTHRTEVAYHDEGGGIFRATTSHKRPGTVAVAAALRERYNIRTVPHIICGEYSRIEIEDQLIDLSYLGITDVLLLRGDRSKTSSVFTAGPNGHSHADSLCRQVCDFNKGIMSDGEQYDIPPVPFTFGVAGYPEKHEEAMNPLIDIENLRNKVNCGASYIVTQMFFDNKKYFTFVEKCREAGIDVPIIPGIKPLTSLRQKELIPRTFHLDLPMELASELNKCKDNDAVKALGIEWALTQARELKNANVPSIHFYAMNATESVAKVAEQLY